jgi:hypothetical protein
VTGKKVSLPFELNGRIHSRFTLASGVEIIYQRSPLYEEERICNALMMCLVV